MDNQNSSHMLEIYKTLTFTDFKHRAVTYDNCWDDDRICPGAVLLFKDGGYVLIGDYNHELGQLDGWGCEWEGPHYQDIVKIAHLSELAK